MGNPEFLDMITDTTREEVKELGQAIGSEIAEQISKALGPLIDQQGHYVREIATLKIELTALRARIDAAKSAPPLRIAARSDAQ
jgi:hypothetical protein